MHYFFLLFQFFITGFLRIYAAFSTFVCEFLGNLKFEFCLVFFILKLSITLDTLTARILKLSSDSQSRIEPTPFYSWWEPTDCRADSAVTPVAHKISPDHRF